MFDNPLDTIPVDTSDAISTNWDPFNFNDQSLNIPPTDFGTYDFPVESVDQSSPYALTSLGGADYGPQAGDFGFTNPQPLSQDDVVGGVPGETSDSQGVITGNDVSGVSNTFGALWKSLTTKQSGNGAAGTSSTVKSSVDAVGSLVKNITQTARIVKDTQTRITSPQPTNSAVAKTNYLNKGASNGLTSGKAPGYGLSTGKMLLIGAGVLALVIIFAKA